MGAIVSVVDTLGRAVVNGSLPALRAYMRYAPVRFGRLPLMGLLMRYHKTHRSRVVEASGPLGMRLVGETRDEIQSALYLCGVWEPNLTSWICQRLGRGDGFVDLGANSGYFSILASRLVGPDGWVVAVEAQPSTYQRLERNVEFNRASNVRRVQIAVFDRMDVLPMYTPGLDAHSGLTSLLESPGFLRIGSVETATIENVLTSAEVETMRLMKIDIEGAEWNVLPSVSSLLKRCRSDLEIVVEITPYPGRSTAALLQPFIELGFSAYVLADDVLDLVLRPKRVRAPEVMRDLELTERSNVILSRVRAMTG